MGRRGFGIDVRGSLRHFRECCLHLGEILLIHVAIFVQVGVMALRCRQNLVRAIEAGVKCGVIIEVNVEVVVAVAS